MPDVSSTFGEIEPLNLERLHRNFSHLFQHVTLFRRKVFNIPNRLEITHLLDKILHYTHVHRMCKGARNYGVQIKRHPKRYFVIEQVALVLNFAAIVN